MKEKLFKTLLREVYTVENLYVILGIFRGFFRGYTYKESANASLRKKFDTYVKNLPEGMWHEPFPEFGEDFLTVLVTDNDDTVLKELENLATTAPQFVIYLPVEFPREELKKISEWVRKNIHAHTLLSVKVDRFSVGGCNFVWNGIFHEYSLRYFMEKRENEIRDLIHTIGK